MVFYAENRVQKGSEGSEGSEGVVATPPQFLAAVWRSVLHSVISTCSVVHPFATSWPSLHGKASHEILSRLWLPTNSVRLPPLKGAQGLWCLLSCHTCCSHKGGRGGEIKKEAPWEELLFISGEIRKCSSEIRTRGHRNPCGYQPLRRMRIQHGVLHSAGESHRR